MFRFQRFDPGALAPPLQKGAPGAPGGAGGFPPPGFGGAPPPGFGAQQRSAPAGAARGATVDVTATTVPPKVRSYSCSGLKSLVTLEQHAHMRCPAPSRTAQLLLEPSSRFAPRTSLLSTG